jgi:Phosphotransferase enzyme family
VCVRTLPDSPSQDHLRQQAKDLLVGLRESQPTASLSDAQASIAQQYGFRTWPELKAEVDRRGGFADVAAVDLANAIADRYALGRVTQPMRSVARADEIGRPWQLRTDRGRWAVRQLNDWVRLETIEHEVRLQEAARGAGIVSPAAARSVAGAIVESIDGCNWRVHESIEAGPPLSAPVNAAIAEQIGVMLAKLHRLNLPAPGPIDPWLTRCCSETSWHELAGRAIAGGHSWAMALSASIPQFVDLAGLGAGIEPPLAIMCHLGVGPSNLRVLTGGGRLALLGWWHAGAFPPQWELASALDCARGVSGEGINMAAARAVLDGYRAEHAVHAVLSGHGAEHGSDMPWPLDLSCFSATVCAWLNWVFGQANMATEATDPNDRRHLDRSVHHLLAHPLTRSDLERLLETQTAQASSLR